MRGGCNSKRGLFVGRVGIGDKASKFLVAGLGKNKTSSEINKVALQDKV